MTGIRAYAVLRRSAQAEPEFSMEALMQRYARAFLKLFATELAQEIAEAEAQGVSASAIAKLYAETPYPSFLCGFTNFAVRASADSLLAINGGNHLTFLRSSYRSSSPEATAWLAERDAGLGEEAGYGLVRAFKLRLLDLHEDEAVMDFDRKLWFAYRTMEDLELRGDARRSQFLLLGLNSLLMVLDEPERGRWLSAGWPELSEAGNAALKNGYVKAALRFEAWKNVARA